MPDDLAEDRDSILSRSRAVTRLAVAALCGLTAAPALAFPTGVPDSAYVSSEDTGGPASVPTSALTAGRDYLIDAFGTGSAEIVGPQGAPVAVLQLHDGPGSLDFRAAYSAVYRLQAVPAPPGYVSAALHPDCRGDVQTTCWLAAGRDRVGLITDPGDRDWYRVALRAGPVYRVVLKSRIEQMWLTLRGPSGRVLGRRVTPAGGGSAVVEYRAPARGTYFVAVSLASSWGANDHVLSLQER